MPSFFNTLSCSAEYETYASASPVGPFEVCLVLWQGLPMTDARKTLQALNDYDAPCSLCRAPPANPYRLMVPGRETCPAGFTPLLTGFLMTAYPSHGKMEYMCVDANAKGMGSAGNENLALFYVTEGLSAFFIDFWQIRNVIIYLPAFGSCS